MRTALLIVALLGAAPLPAQSAGAAAASNVAAAIADATVGAITVEQAFVRALPPGQPTTAAFMRIVNRGHQPVTLTGARCVAADRVEVHEHVVSGDRMAMRQRTDVTIAPGAAVEFAAGGLHLMLIGLRAPLVAAATLPIDLLFDGARTLTVPFTVRSVWDEP